MIAELDAPTQAATPAPMPTAAEVQAAGDAITPTLETGLAAILGSGHTKWTAEGPDAYRVIALAPMYPIADAPTIGYIQRRAGAVLDALNARLGTDAQVLIVGLAVPSNRMQRLHAHLEPLRRA